MYDNLRTEVRSILRKRAAEFSWYVPTKCGEAIGTGAFGAAFKLKDGNVLKIGRETDTTCLWIRESAKRRQQGKALALGMPRVFHLEVLPGGEWWAVMEYVTPYMNRYDEGVSDRFTSIGIPMDGSWLGQHMGTSAMQELYESVRHVFEDEFKRADFRGGDLHGGNWGVANDGRLVVFDPDCGVYAPKPQVIKMKRLHGAGRGRWAQ